MKTTFSIIALMTLASQLAFAETAGEPQGSAAVAPEPQLMSAAGPGMQAGNPDGVSATDTTSTGQLPPLTKAVGTSLQSKLEARMEFDLGPQPDDEQAIASVN